MLISGVACSALMLIAGTIAYSNAQPAGPDQEATWPAGETVSLTGNSAYRMIACTVAPDGRPAERNQWLVVDEPITPDFTGTATITCDQPVSLMTGTSRVIAEYTRGPLIALPMFVAILGILFFFPRFTHRWASLSTSGWLRKRCESHHRTDTGAGQGGAQHLTGAGRAISGPVRRLGCSAAPTPR